MAVAALCSVVGLALAGCGQSTGPATTISAELNPAVPPAVSSVVAPTLADSIAAPGTYVVGKDIPKGVWGPPGTDKANWTTTDDIKSIVVDGVGPTIYNPYGTAQHVSFDKVPDLTGNGDGAQRTNGRWDWSLILNDGQTITVTAPLSVPFALYQAT